MADLTLNIFGNDQSATKAVESLEGKLKGLAKLAGGLAIGAFAADSVKAFMEAEKSTQKLADAFERFPKLAGTNQQAIEDLSSALALKTKYDDDATKSAAAVLAQFDLTGKQLETLLPLVQDYASKTGTDMETAAGKVGKALMGQTRSLKEIGIDYKSTGDKAKDFAEITDLLSEKIGGFAEGEGATAAGKLEILKNQFGEVQETLGEALIPMVTRATEALIPLAQAAADVITWIADLPGPVLAAGAAFAAWLKWGPGVVGMLGKLKVSGAGAMGALKSLGKAAAVGGGIAILSTAIKGAVDEYNSMKTAAAQVATGVSELTEILAANGGAWDQNARDVQKSQVINSEQFRQLIGFGLDYQNTLSVLTGTGGDAVKMAEQFKAAWDAGKVSDDDLMPLQQYMHSQSLAGFEAEIFAKKQAAAESATKATGVAMEATAAAVDAVGSAFQKVEIPAPHSDTITGFGKVRDVLAEIAAIGQRGQIQATIDGIARGLDDIPTNSLDLMGMALQFVADEASDAATQLGYFSLQVDKLAGRSISTEEAVQQLHDQTRNLEEATKGVGRTLVNTQKEYEKTGEVIDTTTQKGSDLQDSVQGYREAYDNSVVAAYQAAEANGTVADGLEAARDKANQTRSGFINLMTQWGLTEDEAISLADKVGILDGASIDTKTFGITANDLATGVIESIKSQNIPTKIATIQAQLIGMGAVNAALAAATVARSVAIGVVTGSATGGAITGPGTGTSDSIPAMLSNGEHVWTAAEVKKAGGQGAMYRMRAAVRRFAAGGSVSQGSLAGVAPRQMGAREGISMGALGDLSAWIKDLSEAARNASRTSRESSRDYRAALADYRKASKEDKAGAKAKVEAAAKQMNIDKRAASAAKGRSDQESSWWKSLQRGTGVLRGLTQMYDRGTKTLAAAQSKLGTLSDKLRDTQQDRAQMAGGIRDSIAGFGGGILGNTDTRRNPQAVLAGLKYNLGKVTSFGSNLAGLKSKGLSADLLAQIAGGGESGMAMAASLAGASKAQIAQVNSYTKQINASAAKSGAAVADAKYAKVLAEQGAAVRRQTAVLNSVQRQQKETDALVKAIAKGIDLKIDSQGMAKIVRKGEQQLAGR